MRIIREKNGTRFENVIKIEGTNGIDNFYYIGVEKLGVMLAPKWQVNETTYFIPNAYMLVVRELLYCGKVWYYTHDDFINGLNACGVITDESN